MRFFFLIILPLFSLLYASKIDSEMILQKSDITFQTKKSPFIPRLKDPFLHVVQESNTTSTITQEKDAKKELNYQGFINGKALIDGKLYSRGNKIGNYIIREIFPDYITLRSAKSLKTIQRTEKRLDFERMRGLK